MGIKKLRQLWSAKQDLRNALNRSRTGKDPFFYTISALLIVYIKVALSMTLVTHLTFHFNVNNFSCLNANRRNHAIQRQETSPGPGTITRDSNISDFVFLSFIYATNFLHSLLHFSFRYLLRHSSNVGSKRLLCYRSWHVHNRAKFGQTGSASSDDSHSQCRPPVSVKKSGFSMNNFLSGGKLCQSMAWIVCTLQKEHSRQTTVRGSLKQLRIALQTLLTNSTGHKRLLKNVNILKAVSTRLFIGERLLACHWRSAFIETYLLRWRNICTRTWFFFGLPWTLSTRNRSAEQPKFSSRHFQMKVSTRNKEILQVKTWDKLWNLSNGCSRSQKHFVS